MLQKTIEIYCTDFIAKKVFTVQRKVSKGLLPVQNWPGPQQFKQILYFEDKYVRFLWGVAVLELDSHPDHNKG